VDTSDYSADHTPHLLYKPTALSTSARTAKQAAKVIWKLAASLLRGVSLYVFFMFLCFM